MSRRMRQEQDLMAKVAKVWHEEATPMKKQSIVQALAQTLGVRGRRCSSVDVVDEGEGRPGADA